MPNRWTAKSQMSGYAVAIAATLTVVVLRLLLSRLLGDSAYFFPFVIAVTLSAWYGGLKTRAAFNYLWRTCGNLLLRSAVLHPENLRSTNRNRTRLLSDCQRHNLACLRRSP